MLCLFQQDRKIEEMEGEQVKFLISANTDIGTTKKTNQDSVLIKKIHTCQGEMAFAVLCDGMGGLEKGEVASATVVRAFDQWVNTELPQLCGQKLEEEKIRSDWEAILMDMNRDIAEYGGRQGIRLGTTVVVLLVTQTRYFTLNVGDSRIYELTDTTLRQLTTDHTFVGREVAMGRMTSEEAQLDARRNVLLQCVGASEAVYPEFLFGTPVSDSVYLLCSDGFRHEISIDEMIQVLKPSELFEQQAMHENTIRLIELLKQRGERDNITAALVRVL